MPLDALTSSPADFFFSWGYGATNFQKPSFSVFQTRNEGPCSLGYTLLPNKHATRLCSRLQVGGTPCLSARTQLCIGIVRTHDRHKHTSNGVFESKYIVRTSYTGMFCLYMPLWISLFHNWSRSIHLFCEQVAGDQRVWIVNTRAQYYYYHSSSTSTLYVMPSRLYTMFYHLARAPRRPHSDHVAMRLAGNWRGNTRWRLSWREVLSEPKVKSLPLLKLLQKKTRD